MKKGQFFEIDMLIAGLIIVASVVLFTQVVYVTQDSGLNTLNNELDDLANILTEVKVGELINSESNQYFDPDRSLARQLLVYNVTGNNGKARDLAKLINDTYLLENRGFSVGFKDQTPIWRHNLQEENQRLTRDLFVTGIESDKPIEGFTGSLFLSKLQRTEPLSYTFGGFVGQGEIDVKINTSGIPNDNISRVRLEGDFPTRFNIQVNNAICYDNSDAVPGIIDVDLNNCVDEMVEGVNSFKFMFTNIGDVEQKYFTGGRIQIYYETTANDLVVRERKYLPGIQGIFNLYDGLQVDSNVLGIDAFIDFQSNLFTQENKNSTFIFSVGDEVVINESNVEGDFSQFETLDINDFAGSLTVPFRVGFDNVSRVIQQRNNVDVVLVTDISSSMKWVFNSSDDGENVVDCSNETELFADDTSRMSVARCALVQFINPILEIDGNNMSMVSYNHESFIDSGLSDDNESLISYAEGYGPSGNTCMSCAFNKSIEVLKDTPSDRERIVVFMADGDANSCIGNRNCGCPSTDFTCRTIEGSKEAVEYATMAHEDYNISLYTVAFALDTGGSEFLKDNISSIDSSDNFYQGTEPESAFNVYEDIAENILIRSQFEGQKITGDFTEDSTLLRNSSYIEVRRNQPSAEDGFIVNLEYDLNNPDASCTSSIALPDTVNVIDAEMISYSRNYWTHNITLNDNVQYSISDFDNDILKIGDPFIFNLNQSNFQAGNNYVQVMVGNNNLDEQFCSDDNKLTIKASIPSFTSETKIFQKRQGCKWTIQFQDEERELTLPNDYTGSNTCEYTENDIIYDNSDLYQQLVFNLLDLLDPSSNPNKGSLPFYLNEEDLDFNFQSVEGLPFLWGPGILEVSISR